jgi:thiosulfate/3-mercaptopyruvate sulfurtransferase
MFTTLISTTDLALCLQDTGLVVLDVRHDLMQPDAWGETQYRAGHLPGARFVHLDRDLSAPKTGKNGRHPLPSPEVAAATFGRLGIGNATRSSPTTSSQGTYASRLWWMLLARPDAVAVLDGGFDKWQREGHPVTTEVPRVQPAAFAIRRVEPTVDADAILASLPTRSLIVVDGRSPERFRGETEPLDPVAGRIPGAINRPTSQNLTTEFTFKPAPQLRAEFEQLLAGAPVERVVHSCGSGVTACHNLLAMQIGVGCQLYRLVGEWCADPSRPVAGSA